jgi:hypothetical protein
MKIISSGIEPATCGLVAQCLNQLRHRQHVYKNCLLSHLRCSVLRKPRHVQPNKCWRTAVSRTSA